MSFLRIEKTEAGDQAVIPETPERIVPTGKLTAKVRQNDAPLELEGLDAAQNQADLFK